jgi:hypothetical protein
MPTLTITDANLGEEVATNGVITKAVLKKVPTVYSNDYLCLADGEVTIFNMHVHTSPVSVDSVIFSGIGSFESLMVKSIPAGCEIEVETADAPTLASLLPDTVVSGSEDFVITCTGTNFVPGTVIRFGPTNDELTTLVSDTEVTTIVKPSLFAPAVVPVAVHTGNLWSDWVDFTFTEPVAEE